jgi:hypothetical protein
MGDTETGVNAWAGKLDPNSIQIWRESLAHLRHLSDEVWKGFRFFMIGNAIIIALGMFLAREFSSPFAVLVLILLGTGFTVAGHYILKRNRIYYLQMLLKKTLVEAEFGFYGARFSDSNTDMSFPWRLNPEIIEELKQKPDEWVNRQVRGPGTIARWLFVMLETIIGIYLVLFLLLCYAWLR